MEKDTFTSFKVKRTVRKQLFEVSMIGRYLTAKKRGLPDFIIIGAQKAGTTSLYNYLAEHPDMLPSKNKEVHYFDENYDRGSDWYRSFFPLKSELEHKITGEASPLYIYDEKVASRVKELLPDIRFIVLLRDPAKRAISHVQHMIRRGVEKRSLQELFENGFDARLALERSLTDPWRRKTFTYLDRGCYARQLKHWFRYFDPSQFLILRSEDFYKSTPEVVGNTLDFLGLRPYDGINYAKAHNQHAYKDPDPELLQSLRQWYAPYNKELQDLIGKEFSWNKAL